MASITLTGHVRKLELEGTDTIATLKFVESISIMFNEVKIVLPTHFAHTVRLGQNFIATLQFGPQTEIVGTDYDRRP